ncbi:MAG: DUF2934 domain-containing protein [Bryobacteraceae bacterium]
MTSSAADGYQVNSAHMQSKKAEEARQVPAHSDQHSAQSLEDAANSDNSLQGYAAINEVPERSEIAREAVKETSDDHEEIARLAYQYYLERGGHHGSHEEDWYRAQQVVRSRRAGHHKSR